jgi:sugar O-acyltransferase (sialic acid O-acetyltransferase NeuD family)
MIYGAGGHATSVANVAEACGFNLLGCVDDAKAGGSVLGFPILSLAQAKAHKDAGFAIAVGDNFHRARIASELGSCAFPTLIHPSAVVSKGATIGDGTVVMPQSVIGPNCRIGRFCIVNTGAIIDHDGGMADYASLAPGVTAGGNVTIGERSAISIGTTVKHKVTIGEDAVVGAHSYVHENVPALVVAYGAPARIIRGRHAGEAYLD